MSYPPEDAPLRFHSSQAASQPGQGRDAWETDGRAPGTPPSAASEGDPAGRWDRPEDERFMMSGLMRRYNR